jgi:hypothetical protein
MFRISGRADLLERSLHGPGCTDQEVRALVATADQVPALTSAACAPREEFVSALGLKLHAEAMRMPTGQAHRASSARTTGRSPTKPMVLVIGKGARVVAAAAACVLLVGAIVGVSSRSALPGGVLYPVKQVLNSAAVQLAGSTFERGVTLLSQAQDDIGDARALVERDRTRADPAAVNLALLSALDSAGTGQQALLGDFDRTRNPQSLIAIQDFAVRAMAQLKALRLQVPASSRADVEALIALVSQSQSTLAREIAGCGQPCAALGSAGLGGSPASPTSGSPTTGPTAKRPAGSQPAPGVPTGRLPVVGPVPAITGPTAAVGHPGSPLPLGGGITPPPITVGSITGRPSPIQIPPLLPLPPTPALPTAPAPIAVLP